MVAYVHMLKIHMAEEVSFGPQCDQRNVLKVKGETVAHGETTI